MAKEYTDQERADAVLIADKKAKESAIRIIEAIIIAAIIGVITMFGTTQAITAKIDYIRSDLSELRQMFVTHINGAERKTGG